MSAVVSTGCSSSRIAVKPPDSSSTAGTPAGTPATTALAEHTSTVVTTAPTTVTAAPTSTRPPQPQALPGPPYPLVTSTVVLIDHSRPTVSHGVTIADSRTLTTLITAPAEPGRWPLLVFAHGYQVGPAPYLTMLHAWAAQGYVVAAPEFPLTDEAVAGPNLDENDTDQQPADMRFVIDELVGAGSTLAGRINPARVGVAGHSDGAETALAVSAEPTPRGEPVIRSVIAMSVSPINGGTHTTNPPLLVTQGDADTINPEIQGVQTWDAAASPKYLAILHGAGHLPPLEAGSPWLSGIEATTEAFLRAYLTGTGTPSHVVAAGTDPPLITITTG